MVKEIAYSLSYVPVDYLRERLGVTELKEDISIDESILALREKEIILHRHQKPFIDRCLPTDETHDRLGLYDKVYASIVQ